ncbi:hypothetical protein [Pseudoxanthomonas sp.]|uniref:hypothetical protein n=1 Tax=Pseudoxanthomonas sp. TaxID=1871049 RepID=UPI002623328E|nr:hypothetical protein [Pseudoxanthomonas sp.]WDS37599.1 MAG: hypothetical protein O8I58_06935 [Pseudoxanthomonas sp.]
MQDITAATITGIARHILLEEQLTGLNYWRDVTAAQQILTIAIFPLCNRFLVDRKHQENARSVSEKHLQSCQHSPG